MASIRVASDTIPIEVNDQGDTIELSTDKDFMKACIRVQKRFEETKNAYDAVLGDDASSPDAQEEAVDRIFEETDAAINELFGKGACNKIFPAKRTIGQYCDFFDQLFAIMDEQNAGLDQKYVQRAQNRRQRRAK